MPLFFKCSFNKPLPSGNKMSYQLFKFLKGLFFFLPTLKWMLHYYTGNQQLVQLYDTTGRRLKDEDTSVGES